MLTENEPLLWLVWSEAVDFSMNRCSVFQTMERISRSVFLSLCPYSKLSLSISRKAVGPRCQFNTTERSAQRKEVAKAIGVEKYLLRSWGYESFYKKAEDDDVSLSIFRGRKSFIPPSILFPEGVSVKLRRIDSPFLFEFFEKELHNKGGG